MPSLSFDKMVALYNETRLYDKGCFDAALSFLTERFPPVRYPKLFEAGIGTGRIAFPLAERGYTITGVDISGEMLAALRQQQARHSDLPVSGYMADVTALPFRDGVFDIAVAVHLFYFIGNWKQAADEILRVCRANGVVVLMHTGTGTEIPWLNERYKALCGEAGWVIRNMGVKSTREVVDYLHACGYEAEWVQDCWTWTAKIRIDKALDYLALRAYSFARVASDVVHQVVMEKLGIEMQRCYGDLGAEIEVPNQIYLVFVRRKRGVVQGTRLSNTAL